jgi:hypothetical protein
MAEPAVSEVLSQSQVTVCLRGLYSYMRPYFDSLRLLYFGYCFDVKHDTAECKIRFHVIITCMSVLIFFGRGNAVNALIMLVHQDVCWVLIVFL